MEIKNIHVIYHLLITWFIQNSVGKHLLVTYWGQTSAGKEKDLKEVCTERKYDIIVIGFVITFFSKENKDEMPEVNFSGHCWDPVPGYPKLHWCPKIKEGIITCQEAGKKVLISLGGAITGNNTLTDDTAKVFAQNLWDLFLGGTGRQDIRPFGSAILNGIDLDIEDHKSGGYAQLVKSLRQLEKNAGSKTYLITGAPQCPYPDASLGPKPGTALGDQGAEFNYVFVQFYNNPCHAGDPQQFYPNMDLWLQFAATAKKVNDFVMILRRTMGKGPKILVGIPAATGGAGKPIYYRNPDEVAAIYEKLKRKPAFGGFMLWDASQDQQNVIDGKLYSDHIADIIGEGSPGPTEAPTISGPTQTSPGPSPSTGGPTTAGPSQTSSAPSPSTGGSSTSGTSKPATSPTESPETTPIPEDFCKGKVDGDYADPNNPAGYISCSGGITYQRTCPEGLVWNEAKKICDWPPKKYQPQGVRINPPPPRRQKQASQSGNVLVRLHRPDHIFDGLPVKPAYKPVQQDRAPVNEKGPSAQSQGVLIQNRVKGLVRIMK